MNKHIWFSLLLLFLFQSPMALAGESDLEARVTQLERVMNSEGLLNLLDELESLQREVRDLRGQIEEQAYTIEQMKKRQQNLFDDLDHRLSAMQGSGTTTVEDSSQEDQPAHSQLEPQKPEEEAAGTVQKSSEKAIKPVETYVANPRPETLPGKTPPAQDFVTENPYQASAINEDKGNEETAYSEAFNLLKQGQHDKAIKQFRAFLQKYPSSDLADNAQYWIGEAYYAKRDFKSALKEYKALLKKYPASGKTSHALLKIGYCYDELGQKDFAQGELEDLIARYPGTSAASLAEERLYLIRSR